MTGTETIATLKLGRVTKTAPMQPGSSEILFTLDEAGTFNSMEITLGEQGKSYVVKRIEVESTDGTIWTSKDVTLEVEPVDKGMRTTEVSYENGASGTWKTTFKKTYSSPTTNVIKTRNGILMESEPMTFNIKGIDKVSPTATMVAKRSSDNVAVTSGKWTNSGLNFIVTKVASGISPTHIYYCKDTNNTCTPNIEATSGSTITALKSATGIYYFRYKIVMIHTLNPIES